MRGKRRIGIAPREKEREIGTNVLKDLPFFQIFLGVFSMVPRREVQQGSVLMDISRDLQRFQTVFGEQAGCLVDNWMWSRQDVCGLKCAEEP